MFLYFFVKKGDQQTAKFFQCPDEFQADFNDLTVLHAS